MIVIVRLLLLLLVFVVVGCLDAFGLTWIVDYGCYGFAADYLICGLG